MRWLSTLTSAAVLSCAQGPAVESAEDLRPVALGAPSIEARAAGCWELRWTPEGAAPGAPMSAMPDSVQLRGGVVFGTSERLVTPATHPSGRTREPTGGADALPPWESRWLVNRWWVEGDAVRIRFSDGEREEWNVTVGFEEEALVGVADHDPGAGTGPASVNARRISCEIR